jgi:hypothetical protein
VLLERVGMLAAFSAAIAATFAIQAGTLLLLRRDAPA